jgi:hypothetical protein
MEFSDIAHILNGIYREVPAYTKKRFYIYKHVDEMCVDT